MNNQTFITDLDYLLNRWNREAPQEIETVVADLYYAMTGSYLTIDLKGERSYLQQAQVIIKETAPKLNYNQIKTIYESFEADLKYRSKANLN